MYHFKCFGHENIRSSHKNTLEFTKDTYVSLEGDCIVGINADFNLNSLKKEIIGKDNLTIVLEINDLKEVINCLINKEFNDDKEIVIRKSDFCSKRTLGLRCDKASNDFSKEFKDLLNDPNQEIIVKIQSF